MTIRSNEKQLHIYQNVFSYRFKLSLFYFVRLFGC